MFSKIQNEKKIKKRFAITLIAIIVMLISLFAKQHSKGSKKIDCLVVQSDYGINKKDSEMITQIFADIQNYCSFPRDVINLRLTKFKSRYDTYLPTDSELIPIKLHLESKEKRRILIKTATEDAETYKNFHYSVELAN